MSHAAGLKPSDLQGIRIHQASGAHDVIISGYPPSGQCNAESSAESLAAPLSHIVAIHTAWKANEVTSADLFKMRNVAAMLIV